MTSNRWRSWHAQEPSADFTERTVEVLLRDMRPRRAPAGRRWAIAGALAAVMVGGAAWGLAGFAKGAPSLPAPPPPVPTEAPAPAAPRAVPAPSVEVAPPPPPPSLRRKLDTPTSASSAGTRRKVVVPRCFCSPNEAICDCF
jgi:hypothetical protein